MWKNNYKRLCRTLLFALALAVVSCGTKKAAVDATSSATGLVNRHGSTEVDARSVMQKVYANQVDARCISSKIKFTLRNGQKDLSVSGSLRMKKNEVIRIQLYVLLMDRMNKQYIKARYADVGFLSSNGLDFYTLQALFWNQLFIPGRQGVDQSALGSFTVKGGAAGGDNAVSLKHGDMEYLWSTGKADGQIKSVDMTYSGKHAGKTSVRCSYGSFKQLGAKKFPTDITLTLSSASIKKAGDMSVNIAIDKLGTDDGWDTFTSVSSKYKQVSVEDLMKRLLKL